MHRNQISILTIGLLVMLGGSGPVQAQNLGSLKNALGGSVDTSSASTGNVAGIIQYCIKNNYLGGGNVASIKDKLMGKMGGEQQAGKDDDYQAGLQGMLLGKDGKKTDLGNQGNALGSLGNNKSVKGMKDKAVRKGCEMVLDQGKSLI